MDHVQNDLSDEVKIFVDALFEAFQKIRESVKRFVNSISKIFNQLRHTDVKNLKVSKGFSCQRLSGTEHREIYDFGNVHSLGYYRPPKNQYLKNKIPLLYRAEQKNQRHLPYHRRIY